MKGLFLPLIIIFGGGLLLISLLRKISRPSEQTPKTTPEYHQKQRVMNSSEATMYHILQKYFGDKYVILSKVRIEDFVDYDRRGLSWAQLQGLRAKIKSRHVDFLICDLASTKPLLAVELDGKSHRNIKRMERDEFIDSVYEEIGLPVRHIQVGSNFAQQALEIKNTLLN